MIKKKQSPATEIHHFIKKKSTINIVKYKLDNSILIESICMEWIVCQYEKGKWHVLGVRFCLNTPVYSKPCVKGDSNPNDKYVLTERAL